MNIFNKKPKVVFTSLIPGLERVMPIVPAKDIQHNWVSNAMADYRKQKENPEFLMKRSLHTARCPGIFTMHRTGWVLRNWQDFVIETNGDGESFAWSTPIDSSKWCDTYKVPSIEHHGKEQLFNFMDKWRSDTLRVALKINTPWIVDVPDGYYLLEMPVANSDEVRFSAFIGVYDKEYAPPTLNIALQWHVLNGKTLIKAGTPLAQYILVKKDDFDFECNAVKEASDHDVGHLAKHIRFFRNYKELRSIFSRKG